MQHRQRRQMHVWFNKPGQYGFTLQINTSQLRLFIQQALGLSGRHANPSDFSVLHIQRIRLGRGCIHSHDSRVLDQQRLSHARKVRPWHLRRVQAEVYVR